MVKLIALYKQPEDKEAFDRHYFKTHTALTKKIPGLREMNVTKIKNNKFKINTLNFLYKQRIRKME